MKRALSRFIAKSDGVATLEMAVVLPFLLTLIFGAVEFGNAIYNYHLVTVGVRDAARYLSGVDFAANQTNAKNIAVFGKINPAVADKPRVPGFAIADITIPALTAIANDDGSGNKIYRGGANVYTLSVSASVPYQDLGLVTLLGVGPIVFSFEHQERYFGVR